MQSIVCSHYCIKSLRSLKSKTKHTQHLRWHEKTFHQYFFTPTPDLSRSSFSKRFHEDNGGPNGPVLNICLLSYYHFSSSTSCRILTSRRNGLALSKGLDSENDRKNFTLRISCESLFLYQDPFTPLNIHFSPITLLTFGFRKGLRSQYL